jgi:uncharacterized protein YqgC (DUF456 family)
MIARKTKYFSAAVVAVALIASVAVARTVHTRAAADAQATTGSVTGASAGPMTAAPSHGNFACPLVNAADCEKLETWQPE